MKKVVWFILIFFTSTISVFGLDFYEGYYVDEFGDKTEEWYICSEAIFGTSPNTLGGITAFRGKLYIDNDNAFFEIKRQNGDTYSGDGTIHIKRENGDVVYFSADNEYGNFYPEDAESLRNLILNENIIKVVVTIDNTPYKFNLGEISLIELHTILASNGKISKQEQSIVSIETMILTTTGSIPAVIIVSPKLEYNFNDTLALKTIQEKVNSIEQYLNEYLLMKSFDELQDKNKIKQEVKDIINNKILLKSIVKDVIFTNYIILKSPL